MGRFAGGQEPTTSFVDQVATWTQKSESDLPRPSGLSKLEWEILCPRVHPLLVTPADISYETLLKSMETANNSSEDR
ncbi:hypothetical protein J6590_059025 [Homalodisca vitripennis]|nr:hypothetical protein J6590_059025 [Homalodisca vitripennis]